MDPFISVITVSLNAAASIEDTIASVAMQAFDYDVEHICVDGGSTDGTRQIIERWAERTRRVRRIFEPDTGIFDAMNKGLRAARGEYVLFLNADDFLASQGALASALKGLSPHAADSPDIIAAHVHMGGAGGLGFWRNRRVPALLGSLPGLFAVHQGQLVKRRILMECGGFDARMRLAADVTLYYDIERRFRPTVRRVDEVLTFMRAGGAANANFRAVVLGSTEIFRHLRPVHGVVRSTAMVSVKTMQSLLELRFGSYSKERWFANAGLVPRGASVQSG